MISKMFIIVNADNIMCNFLVSVKGFLLGMAVHHHFTLSTQNPAPQQTSWRQQQFVNLTRSPPQIPQAINISNKMDIFLNEMG